jgi:hypothetical protein
MTIRSRSGALTAGLILICIGLIFFLKNMYEHFSAWRLIARYWPAILIIIGLRKLYDYFTWQEIPPVTGNAPKE